MQLGIADRNGVVRFASTDINECREFLRSHGLEYDRDGWEGNGQIGLIQYHNGQWHAAAWKTETL